MRTDDGASVVVDHGREWVVRLYNHRAMRVASTLPEPDFMLLRPGVPEQ